MEGNKPARPGVEGRTRDNASDLLDRLTALVADMDEKQKVELDMELVNLRVLVRGDEKLARKAKKEYLAESTSSPFSKSNQLRNAK
jgi:hypothetical protein